ncbi:MAG: helix-turn-helix domain-containing protein [Clostridium sp.]|uniref:helix-turn-helix domain-containing protein n=1 Tax=Clostridium sp. TaxID=1506 RepID=UPI003F336E72
MFKNINGERIKQARIYRGMSQAQLAKELEVTKQAISKYEANKMNLSINVISALPKVLEFPLSFFGKETYKIDEKNEGIVFFRTKNIPQKTQAMLSEKIKIMEEEILEYFEKYIEFPSLNLPNLENELGSETHNYNRERIIKVCEKLREHWGLGKKPIDNLMYILQKNGFIVNKQLIDQDKTDGFSQKLNEKNIIFVSANKESAVRTRFDLAHELGHLILHNKIEKEDYGEKIIELDADFFASEFLYPVESFIEEIKDRPLNFETFIILKEKWKISMQAIIRKCKDFDLISDDKYMYFQKRLSFNRWRKKEPLDDRIVSEEPRLLKDIIEVLIENKIVDKKQLLMDIELEKNQIIEFCNLSEDFFDDTFGNIIKLYK